MTVAVSSAVVQMPATGSAQRRRRREQRYINANFPVYFVRL